MKINLIIMTLCACCFNTVAQDKAMPEALLNHLNDFPSMRDFTLSNNGEEAYITALSPLEEIAVLLQLVKSDGDWAVQGILPFSGTYRDLEPFLSKDNLRLYFASNRPKPGSTEISKDFDIWYVERTHINEEWGVPVNIGAPVNTENNEFYPSIAQSNNLYFTSDRPNSKGKDDIYFSQWQDQGYSEPTSLSDSINTVGYEFNAFVSYDESYLIFTGYGREDGFGSGDLYISHKGFDHKWGKAVNMGGNINSKQMDYCPLIDEATKILYFTSKRSEFEQLNNFHSLDSLIEMLNKSENGMSKIYQVSFEGVPFTPAIKQD